MNRNEAYKILELQPNASKEDIKKQYRKMAAKYHPDVCKESGAEEKFKQINAANDCLSKEDNQMDNMFDNQSSPFNSPFNPFSTSFESFIHDMNIPGFGTPANPNIKQRPQLFADVNISFIESVVGCKKEVKVQKYVACTDCKGQGFITEVKPCNQCKGGKRKTVTKRQGNTSFTTVEVCSDCYGTGNSTTKCETCHGEASILQDRTMTVAIPPGIQNNQVMRLSGGGNFTITFQGVGAYSDANFKVIVAKEHNMKLIGRNVVSTLDISLLEALEGTTKKVQTIVGEKELIVPKMSKNNDDLRLKGLGIPNAGDHIFYLDVKYPSNADKLINWLKEGK